MTAGHGKRPSSLPSDSESTKPQSTQSTVRIEEAKQRQDVCMRCLGTAVLIVFAADRSGVALGIAPDSTQTAERAEALRAAAAMDSILAADAAHCFPPRARWFGLPTRPRAGPSASACGGASHPDGRQPAGPPQGAPVRLPRCRDEISRKSPAVVPARPHRRDRKPLILRRNRCQYVVHKIREMSHLIAIIQSEQ